MIRGAAKGLLKLMSVNLYEVFEHFCNATDSKLRWGDDRKRWTSFVLDIFDNFMRSKGLGESRRNYMGIDAVWRDPSLGNILLALEHENERRTEDFVAQEMHRLLDLKSLNKVAITYPHAGEERETIEAIRAMIPRGAMLASDTFFENYLIIFGFDTRHKARRAILWRGYSINRKGEVDERERVVFAQD